MCEGSVTERNICFYERRAIVCRGLLAPALCGELSSSKLGVNRQDFESGQAIKPLQKMDKRISKKITSASEENRKKIISG
jgi:hypothetical protein